MGIHTHTHTYTRIYIHTYKHTHALQTNINQTKQQPSCINTCTHTQMAYNVAETSNAHQLACVCVCVCVVYVSLREDSDLEVSAGG